MTLGLQEIEKTYRIDEDGAIFSIKKGRYLKPFFNTSGYMYVRINSSVVSVRQLVALKYLGEPPKGQEITDKDRIRSNNHYTNLQYLPHNKIIIRAFNYPRTIIPYNRPLFADKAKETLSNARSKPITITEGNNETIHSSIDEASKYLNTYRKKVYRAIAQNKPINGSYIRFTDIPS
jgi:hypothetical protein